MAVIPQIYAEFQSIEDKPVTCMFTTFLATVIFCFIDSKINIGSGFQAEVPSTIELRQATMYDKHRAAVCWIPFEHETRKRAQES